MANGYLTFKGTAAFTLDQHYYTSSTKTWNGTLEYSTNGSTWTTWSSGATAISSSSTAPYVLYLRGTGNTRITGTDSKNRFVFTTTGTIECIGRIDTLLDYQTVLDGGTPAMTTYCYAYMFYNCTSLISTPALPATTLAESCYRSLFRDCASLTSAPALPATTLATYCYSDMFAGCTSLTSAPALPATTLADSCYRNMFQGCTSLTSAPALPATALADNCYRNMFNGCTSLTSVPALSVTTLKANCYSYMFYNCTNIKLAPIQGGTYKTPFRIPSTGTGTVGTDSLKDMFTGTGGSFKTTPTINTTYYIAHTYMNNVTLNAKWTENMSMTPDGLTAGQDASGYVTENISNTFGNLVHCVKQIDADVTTLSYMKYIMEGMMVARVVDFDNLTQSLLIGDFNRLNCFKNRKRCTVAVNGTINHWYGETGYVENGTNGDVMVYQPKFYYKVEPIKLEPIAGSFGYHIRKAIYYISDAPIGGFKLHPAFVNPSGNEVDHFFIGAYEGCIYDVSSSKYDLTDSITADFTATTGDKFASISGAKPASGIRNNLTVDNLLILCKNKGSGWYSMGLKQYSMNQLMMLIEYGPDSQAGIGLGVIDMPWDQPYNCSSITGSTSILGNNTGMATSTINEINGTQTTYNVDGKVSVSYRGMENPYGNIWEAVQGGTVYGNGTDAIRGGQLFVSDDFNYIGGKHADNYKPIGFTVPTFGSTAGSSYSEYIKAFGYGDEKYDWVMMGSDAGTDETSIIKDYHYTVTKLNGSRTLLLGGNWAGGDVAGAFYWEMDVGVNVGARTIGGRLCKYVS